MPAANVPMIIDQGEDWTTEIVWTDNYEEPMNVISPCRLDIKNSTGATQLSLETNDALPAGETAEIAVSSDIGLIQLHIDHTVTAALLPGEYQYDLFVTVDDGSGAQINRLLYGSVTVNKRVTQMV